MRLVLLLFLLGVGFAASDATEAGYVTGLIEQDATWRDTVYVGGDVTVTAAATVASDSVQIWGTSSQRSAGQETTNLSRSVVAARDSTQVDSGYAKASDQDSGQGKRIAGQLIVGTFMVVVVFYMFSGFFLGVPGM